MHCPQCGETLQRAGVLCPHCGATLPPPAKGTHQRGGSREEPTRPLEVVSPDVESTPVDAASEKEAGVPVAGQRHRLWLRLLLILLGGILFVGVLAGAGYYGVYAGERDREAARQAVIAEHYDAGIAALNEGRFERAAAEFSYVLQLDDGHALARQGLTEARVRLEVKPTPTLEAAQSLAEQFLAQAQESYAAGDWVATAHTLTQLRALDPKYEVEEVEELLFTSLYNAAQQYLEEDNLEVGISYLDQAIALRPLAVDAELVRQRNLAARYLDALSYWGVDWELCIERFKALYATAHDYKDVPQRLYRAYLSYGDYFFEQGEMCPAEFQYTHALRMYADPTVEEKRAQAAQTCLIATPVAAAGDNPALTPQPIAGFTQGRLAYPVYNANTGLYDLYALYADGRIIRAASSADQPWWDWATWRVTYRDRVGGGINMVLPEEGVPLQLLAPAGQAWPTLSPDSQRIAYAAPAADGTWSIYTAATDGSGAPQLLGPGWAPAWGRTGTLAYTGCDNAGCGIVVDNPDDDQPARRLTGSENDQAVSWAPAGNLMAYMSNVTGNWDLYLLSPEGGVQPFSPLPSNEGLPTWSPDGGSLAFISDRNGSWAVYVQPLDGQPAQRVLDLGAELPGWENQRLSWAP